MKFLGVFIEATSGICLGHNDDPSDQLKRGQSWFVETLWLEFIPTFTMEKKKKKKKKYIPTLSSSLDWNQNLGFGVSFMVILHER